MPAPDAPAAFKALVSDPTATLCGNFTNTLLRLPVLLYRLVNYMFDFEGNLTAAFKQTITDLTIRTGDLIFSAAPVDTDGRLLCNGAAVSRATYAALFAKISTAYGVGDGTTTFNVPDYRDKFPRGVNAGVVGATGGSETVTIDISHVPPHSHGLKVRDSGAGGSGQTYADRELANVDTENEIIQTEDTGGTGTPAAAAPFQVLNPYVSCFIYIKI